jgi:hypothetical protein
LWWVLAGLALAAGAAGDGDGVGSAANALETPNATTAARRRIFFVITVSV